MKRVVLIFFTMFSLMFGANNSILDPNGDSDNDLVINSKDRCPNTPEDLFVDRYGCTVVIKRTLYFDRGAVNYQPKYQYIVDELVELAKDVKGYKIKIEGNTDSVADDIFNLNLSKKRAKKIYQILLKNGIDKKRISVKWYGEINPIATNITKEGRAKNRRVDIIFY